MSEKKPILHWLSDISRIHHRAAFTDVAKHTTPRQSAFLKLCSERYSCRSFKEGRFMEDELASILEAGRLAPTACNKQPVHIWVVKTAEALAKLKEATKYTFNAPAVLIVGYKPEEAWVRACDGKNGGEVDAAIVATHIMLEAAAIGLGTTWVGSFNPAKIAELFPQTQGWVPVVLLPVGYPAAGPSENHAKRKDWTEIVSDL